MMLAESFLKGNTGINTGPVDILCQTLAGKNLI